MAVLNIKLPTNLTEYPNSFKRQGSFPLEAYSVFYAIHGEDGSIVTSALDAAKDYAKNNPISYVGQILAVVDVAADDGTSEVKVYKIENANGDLVPVGDTAAADAAVEALEDRLDALEEAYVARFEAIEGDVEALEAADEAFEQALANIYTKSEVEGLIKEEADRAAAAEKALEDAVAAMYTNAQIDEAIKAEADRAKGVEADLISDIADLELAVATKANADDVYTKEEVHTYVAGEIGSAGHLKRTIVAALPEGEDIDVDTIYMVAKEGVEGSDVYVEYMWINYEWEVIGDTTVDLTPYAKTADVEATVEAINAEIALKAVKADVDTAFEAVETALGEKATKSEVEAVSTGAKTYTDEEIAKVNAVVETKVDVTTYNEQITNITENVSNITQDITNITNIIGGTEDEGDSLLTRVSALETGKADKATTLAGYGITDAYTKGEVYTRAEIADLIADITGGESAADVLAALNTYIGTNDQAVAALQAADTDFETRVSALEAVGAQANVLEAINFNGQDIAIVDKKATFSYTYELPAAMADALGGVKSSDAENKIAVDAEGIMEVNSLNVNKLTQTEGDTLVLNGGSANL
jgi:hypothetical protein